MIAGKEIPELVKLLEMRGVCLYHACQLVDFKSYLKLGGIPSRAHLEKLQEDFTLFETDVIDRLNDVWDKVFANLSDFGRAFAYDRRCVPNAYGPIALQIQPAALLDASDVAVCLRSAGASDFNRITEALNTTADVDKLFLYDRDCGVPESIYIKYGEPLRTYHPDANTPEVSCSVAGGFFPLEYLVVAWVDPYKVSGDHLLERVALLCRQYGSEFPVRQRSCTSERKVVYGEIVERLLDSPISINSWIQHCDSSIFMKEWGQSIIAGNLEYQFNRFANYLYKGTIQPLIKREQ